MDFLRILLTDPKLTSLQLASMFSDVVLLAVVIHAHSQMYTHTHNLTHTCSHTYTHTHTHTHTHTRMHTCTHQGCRFSVNFRFFCYFWPDSFSIFSYFIFLFLNFLSLFVFIFCKTARTRRFSVILAKVQWHP